MSPEKWQQVKSILDECLEQPGTERSAYLSAVCTDPDLRSEVESLLKAHDRSTEFLEERSGLGADIALAFETDALVGQRIGPYLVESVIGEGGMGTVYRGVRADDEFRIVVAIKVVSRGSSTTQVLRRFRTERQILASLDHPYIARLLDGGTTEAGLPYFVMEFVDGVPLHRYCDEKRLGIPERLDLFRRICEAVSYAHRQLIVHRDLKPGNILVTEDGTPKLLDFGIAKILTANDTEPATHTATIRMATPAYASPEQIRGKLVGTASDVYSLGVILYELLTGQSPYPLHRGEPGEMAVAICDREPTRPSVVLESLSNYDISSGEQRPIDIHELSERRSTTPEGLRRKLHGELDTIIATALRKEPERRYASVEQFSEDVRRYLEGLPLLARKDTFSYRTLKFVSRHRAGVALGTAALLLLFVTTGVAVWKARELSLRVEEDHKLATSFLVDIHEAIAKLPGATPARQALLEQSLRYMNGLHQDVGSDPQLDRSLALAYEKFADLQGGAGGAGLGNPSAALETCLRGQAIRERLAAANPGDLQIQRELVNNYLIASFLVGRTRSQDKRLEYDRKALALAEKLAAAEPDNKEFQSILAKAHISIAYAHTFSAQFDESRKHFAEALAIRTALASSAPEDFASRKELAHIHYRIGTSYTDTAQPAKALEHLRRAYTIQEQLVREQPDNAPIRSELASTHHFLGIALSAAGQLTQALDQFNRAIALRETALEKDPRDARARSLLAGNYAERAKVELAAGEKQASLRSIGFALELQEALHKLDPRAVPTRISLADQLGRLGMIHVAFAESPDRPQPQRLSSWRAAARAFRRADQLYEQLLAEGHTLAPAIRADATRVKSEAARCERFGSEHS